jgi:hypothetical protein
MTREDMLARANRWTAGRYGIHVTKRMLEDWVHEGLVPGPRRVPNPGQRAARFDWPASSYAFAGPSIAGSEDSTAFGLKSG